MRKIAAVFCIAAMLISSTALARQSNSGSENRERNGTHRVQQDKPKERVQNGSHQNERNRQHAYSKPRQKIQKPQGKKPKKKISANRHRNGHDRRHAYARPHRGVRHAGYGHHRTHGYQRKPIFSLLHWSWCSHGCN